MKITLPVQLNSDFKGGMSLENEKYCAIRQSCLNRLVDEQRDNRSHNISERGHSTHTRSILHPQLMFEDANDAYPA